MSTEDLTPEAALKIATELHSLLLKRTTGITYELKITEEQFPDIIQALYRNGFGADKRLSQLENYVSKQKSRQALSKSICDKIAAATSYIDISNLQKLKENLDALELVIKECKDQIKVELDEPTGTSSDNCGKYRYWMKNGNFHRENDRPARDYDCGRKEYVLNGNTYRIILEDGTVLVNDKYICDLIDRANGK